MVNRPTDNYYTKRIKKWKGYPHLIHFHGYRDRDLNQDHLDRIFGANKFVYMFQPRYLDVHLLRPGFTEVNWKKLISLAALLLNDE